MTEPAKLINFRLSISEIERLENVAKRNRQTKSELARDLISRGLDRLEISQQQKLRLS